MKEKSQMVKITIEHQIEKTKHNFLVKDSKNLLQEEVKLICKEMGVQALLIEGKYYKNE